MWHYISVIPSLFSHADWETVFKINHSFDYFPTQGNEFTSEGVSCILKTLTTHNSTLVALDVSNVILFLSFFVQKLSNTSFTKWLLDHCDVWDSDVLYNYFKANRSLQYLNISVRSCLCYSNEKLTDSNRKCSGMFKMAARACWSNGEQFHNRRFWLFQIITQRTSTKFSIFCKVTEPAWMKSGSRVKNAGNFAIAFTFSISNRQTLSNLCL